MIECNLINLFKSHCWKLKLYDMEFHYRRHRPLNPTAGSWNRSFLKPPIIYCPALNPTAGSWNQVSVNLHGHGLCIFKSHCWKLKPGRFLCCGGCTKPFKSHCWKLKPKITVDRSLPAKDFKSHCWKLKLYQQSYKKQHLDNFKSHYWKLKLISQGNLIFCECTLNPTIGSWNIFIFFFKTVYKKL